MRPRLTLNSRHDPLWPTWLSPTRTTYAYICMLAPGQLPAGPGSLRYRKHPEVSGDAFDRSFGLPEPFREPHEPLLSPKKPFGKPFDLANKPAKPLDKIFFAVPGATGPLFRGIELPIRILNGLARARACVGLTDLPPSLDPDPAAASTGSAADRKGMRTSSARDPIP